MAKKYYWLKLKDDWFNSKVIKKLRKIAGGDTYTVIYLKLLLLSLRSEGKLYYEGIEDSFEEELALDLDEEFEDVSVTVAFLRKCGLMEVTDANEYFLTEIPASIGCESESAERVRKHRYIKNKKLLEEKTLQCNAAVTDCNGGETTCNTEIEIEKEIEKEIDLTVSDDTVRQTDVRRVVDEWNSLGLSPVQKITGESKRGKALKARIREYGVDEVIKAVRNVSESTFLRGGSKSGWMITFDWFVKPNNFPKVLEGQYSDRTSPETVSSVDASAQNGRGLSELEKLAERGRRWAEGG
jgi:predicted phage replisome organizer